MSKTTEESSIGSLISLISNHDVRYEGILHHLSTENSTILLKNVRCYGTEGRNRDGPQVPPSDTEYEFVCFCGSDIKDLQVRSSPPSLMEGQPYNDPAIIQSHYAVVPSSSSPSVSDRGKSLIESAQQQMTPALISRTCSTGISSFQFGNNNSLDAPWHSLPLQSPSTLSTMSMQNQQASGLRSSPVWGLADELEPVTPVPSTLHTLIPNPLSTQTPLAYPYSVDMQSYLSPHVNNQAPIMSSTLLSPQDLCPNEVQPLTYPALPHIGTSHLSLPLSLDQQVQFTPAALLSQPSPLKSQYNKPTIDYTEEFDFEAMNEKFKKDEVWGFLGKQMQRNSLGNMNHDAANQTQNAGVDPKPAYIKDDFFDTISSNSLTRGQNERSHFSERMKPGHHHYVLRNRGSHYGQGRRGQGNTSD